MKAQQIYGAQAPAPKETRVDLRSDTVTRPCADMRAAMAEAAVGDDVFGEDPTVAALEAAMAARLGKSAAVFFPTGTQSNLAAMLAHCGRGDEILVGEQYHTFTSEAGGMAAYGGAIPCPLPCAADGSVSAADVAAAAKPDDPHYPISRLLCLENTVGGRALTREQIAGPAAAARAAGLKVHLDGARLFNACVALGVGPAQFAELVDTVSICLSKGLGAPAGTVLVGDAPTLAAARRLRKSLGGGMRQSGVLAAAGLFALERLVERLAEDHDRAARLRAALAETGAFEVTGDTNMAFVAPRDGDCDRLRAHLAEQGVRIGRQSPVIRLVLHRDVDDTGLAAAIAGFQSYRAG